MDILGKIRRLQDERGWTDYLLAKQSGIPQSTVSNMFARNNTPTIPTLESLCNGFGITLSQFFTDEGEAVCLTEEQRKLLNDYALLSKGQKEKLMVFLNGMLTK